MTLPEQPDEPAKREPIKASFSVPQILGAALAAATAAAVGSQLGLAGTIVGAALASVVAGVGSTLYSVGIDRTHRRVQDAIGRGYQRVRQDEPPASATGNTSADSERASGHEVRNRALRMMVISAGLVFLLALLVITAVELGIGRSLDGSPGTTVSEVVRPRRSQTPTPAPSPTQSSQAPSPEPTPTPTPEPTPTETESPTPTPNPTTATAEPSPSSG